MRTMLHATLLRVVPERSTAKHLASLSSCNTKHATACVASRLTTPPTLDSHASFPEVSWSASLSCDWRADVARDEGSESATRKARAQRRLAMARRLYFGDFPSAVLQLLGRRLRWFHPLKKRPPVTLS